jgi:restriction system protein
VIKGALYDRLFNLIDRRYVARSGLTYEITDAGLAYLARYAQLGPGQASGSKQSELHRLAAELSRQAREQLATYLSTMNPFKFEALIKLLLEEMGYIGVEVTARYLIPASEVERVRREENYGEPEGQKIGHYASA